MPSPNAQRVLIQKLEDEGIDDRRVLDAMGKVPRDAFVPEDLQYAAYEDRALPIGEEQTISQPYMVALMTQALLLKGGETVLEIGTGSGYQAAILADLCRQVCTIERIAILSLRAREVLDRLGYHNIDYKVGDGSLGWKERAPFNRIVVTAGAPAVPPELYQQLTLGGHLVIPVGSRAPLMLQRVTRQAHGPEVTDLCACAFVPLIGAEGWSNGRE